jgi:hypothetical protein
VREYPVLEINKTGFCEKSRKNNQAGQEHGENEEPAGDRAGLRNHGRRPREINLAGSCVKILMGLLG